VPIMDNPSEYQLPTLFARALDEVTVLVESLTPELSRMPTPCPEWTVGDLVEHLVGLNLGLVEALLIGEADNAAYRHLVARLSAPGTQRSRRVASRPPGLCDARQS
jgi:hypothetical protein